MIFILDRQERVINILKNNGGNNFSPFFDDILTEDLATGGETFQFSTIANNNTSKDLVVGNFVAFKRNDKLKLFQIMQVEESHEEVIYTNVYCESAGLELINKIFRKTIMNSVTLRKFMETVLADTGWSVGLIEGSVQHSLDLEIEDATVYSVLQNTIQKFGCELEFRVEIVAGRITSKYVDVYGNRGKVTGKRFVFGQDIEGLVRKTDFTEFYTALIGVGKNGTTFRDVTVEGIDKPLGQDFVADQEAYERYNHNGYHIMGKFEFDTTSPEELLRETYKKLQEVKEVRYEYEVSVALLGRLLGEKWNDVAIGDTVAVVDNAFNPPIHLMARVSKLETSMTDPQGDTCTLSNFVEVSSNITDEMRKIASELEGYVDGALDKKFPIGGEDIQEGAVNGSHIYQNTISTDHLVADAVTADKIKANSIETKHLQADSIKSEHIDTEQIEAEHIKSGTITADKITSDEFITNSAQIKDGIIGTAQIGDAQITVAKIQDLFVDDLVANQGKFQSAHIGVLTSDNIDADTIKADHIMASVIDAINLNVEGKISADKIDVTDLVVDNIDAGKITTGTLDADRITSSVITAINASMENATINEARIGNLSANKITAGDISADRMKANAITAINATIGNATINSAKIGELDASKITTGTLDADRIEAGSIDASKINSDTINAIEIGASEITANKIASGEIKVGDANIIDGTISGAKITKASIGNAQISEAFIADAFVKNITADKIKGGTLDAKEITVKNLNADSITVGQINGRQIAGGAISYDKLDSILSGDIRNTIDNVDQALEDVGLVQETVKKTVKSVDVEYAMNTSSTTAPTTGWQSKPPTWENGKFIWSRTTTVLSDGTSTTTDAVCITGAKGAEGAQGKGVKSIVEQYYLSTSNTTQSGGSWANSPQAWVDGKYMWTRSVITYTDNTTTTTNAVCVTGAKGSTGSSGIGIKSVDVEYYLSASATELSGGSWSTTAPAWVNGKYMWSRTKTVKTDDTVIYSNPACITGAKGDTGTSGKGVKSIVEQYYLSTSNTDLNGGSWTTTPPTWSNGKYMWTRSVITYTDNSSTTTNPVCVSGSKGDKGDTGSKGDKGDTGVGIQSVDVEYYLSTSSTSLNGGSWSTTAPTWVDGKYMWSRTKTVNTSGKTTYSNSVCITGGKGATGATGASGKGIKSTAITYQASSSGTTTPTGTWSTTIPSVGAGQYLWTRTVITYTDNSTVTSYSIGKMGEKGATGASGNDGKGIKSTVVTYQASTSGTTVPTGSWVSSIPSVSAGQFLWTRTVITYTDNTSSTSYSVGKMGEKGATGATGATGQGVESITEEYYLSTSKTTQTGGSWVTTPPAWSTGKYMWTRSKIVYKNPTATAYTTPVCDSSWEAVNDIEVGGRNIIGKDINNISKWSLNYPERFSISNVEYDNTLIYKTTGGGWETAISDGIAVIPNKEYVLSFEYEVFNEYSYLSGETFRVEVLSERIVGNSSKSKAIAFHTIEKVATPRKRVYITFTPTTSTIYLMINGGYIADGLQNLKFSFNKFKLEKGNKATDWTPALEDTTEEISKVTSIANGKNSVFYSTSAPSTSDKKENDIWFDTDDGHKMYKFSNGAWVATQFGTNAIVSNAITADKIASSSITAGKIASGAVTTDKLYALAVTADKISANAITAGKIATDAVLANNIKAGAVTTDKVSAKAINADKLDVDNLFVGDNAFIKKLKAVEIDASNITTGTISNDRIDIRGLISFEALDESLKPVFNVQGDKTYINGGLIATNTIKANSIDLLSGITVQGEDGTNTFAIAKNGNVEVNGLLHSGNFDENKNIGYKISPDGTAILNQATIRGDVKLPNAGITNYGATIGNENLLLKSGSFSNNTGNWGANGSTISLDNTTKYNDSPTIKIVGNTGAIYNGFVQLERNTTYIYSATVKANKIINGGGSAPLHMWLNTETSSNHLEIVTLAKSTITTEWNQVYVVFKTPNEADRYFMKPFIYNIGDATVWLANAKVEKTNENKPTPWSPHKDEQLNYVRFWAGTSFGNRESAPFRVYQNGDVFASNGTFTGLLRGTLDSGDVQIYNNAITIHAPKTETEVIRMEAGQSFLNTDVVFGNNNDKRIEYLNENKEFNVNVKNTLRNSRGSFEMNYIGGSGNNGTYLVSASHKDGGRHHIKYWNGYGGLIFESEGTNQTTGKENPYDFKFERANSNVNVKIQGNLEVTNSIKSDKQNIEMRSVSNEGWGFYAT